VRERGREVVEVEEEREKESIAERERSIRACLLLFI